MARPQALVGCLVDLVMTRFAAGKHERTIVLMRRMNAAADEIIELRRRAQRNASQAAWRPHPLSQIWPKPRGRARCRKSTFSKARHLDSAWRQSNFIRIQKLDAE
jgi:hypothetical protein